MDPAGLMFAGVNLTNRVDRSDADFVLVLHSNMGTRVTSGLGAWERLGHVDVYLNGGAIQPGCISLSNPLTHDQVFADETNRTSTGDRTKFRPRHMIRSYSSGLLNTNRILQVSKFRLVSTDSQPQLILLVTCSPQYLYCHHARARRFFELFINDHCQPVAYQCNSYEDFLHGHCWSCGEHGERCFLSVYIAEHEAKRMAVLNRDTSKSYFVLSNDRRPLCSKL